MENLPLFQRYHKLYWKTKRHKTTDQNVKTFNKNHNAAKTLVEKSQVIKDFLIECDIYQKTSETRAHKNEMESVHYRDIGDEALSSENMTKALISYNLSIRLAKPETEDLGLAYIHRSSVYFQLQRYYDCFLDIQRAKENGFPANLIPKLQTRVEICYENIRNKVFPTIPRSAPPRFVPRLTYIPHQNVPFVVRVLEMRTDPKYGKGLYAKTDLNPGDIVIMEKPVIRTLALDIRDRCSYCFKENHLNLLPCDHCTVVMFCSTTCQKQAYAEFHKYECSMIDAIMEMKQNCVLLTMRMTWLAMRTFRSTFEWKKFVNSFHYENTDNFHLNHQSEDLTDQYSSIMCLLRDETLLDETMRFHVLMTALKVEELILRDVVLQSYFQNDKQFLREILIRHSVIAALNCKSFTRSSE
jgi:hypothetical protein